MRASIARYAAVALIAISGSAQAVIPLSNAPLFLSTAVAPNVMLLFDNSGSMENIIWADGYNPSTTYADWSPRTCGNNSNTQCWTATDGNVGMSDIKVKQGTELTIELPGLAAVRIEYTHLEIGLCRLLYDQKAVSAGFHLPIA